MNFQPDKEKAADTTIVLIHGVGLPSEELFGKDLEHVIDSVGIGTYDVVRVDWHHVVAQPVKKRLVDYDHLEKLMRGFIGASARAKSSSVIHTVLHLLFAFAPLAILGQLMLLVWPAPQSIFARALTAYWLIAGGLALLLFGRCLLRSGLAGVSQALRQLLLLVLWPLVFIGVQLFAPLGAILAGVAAVGAVIFSWIYGLPERWEIAADGAPIVGRSGGELILSYFVVPLVAFVGYLCIAYLARLARWPLKVLADVVRFMGDRKYFDDLMGHIESQLGSLNLKNRRRLIVVGHSLGSAIAAVYLWRRAEQMPSECWVHFVTMGSPLTRLLGRFFAGTWPGTVEIARGIAAKHPRFAWTNVYRPFDPIGARLFARRQADLLDVSTRQYRKLPHTAHVGYWDDSLVAAKISDAVREHEKRLPVQSSSSVEVHDPSEDNDWRVASSLVDRYSRLMSSWIPVTFISVLLGTLIAIPTSRAMTQKGDLGRQAMLEKLNDRRETTGWLYQFFSFTRFRADRGFGQCVVFTPEGRPQVVLQRYRYPTFSGGEKTHVWFHAPERKVDAIRFPVRVTYARNDPALYFLPGYEKAPRNQPEASGKYTELFGTAFTGVVWWFAVGMLLYTIWPCCLGSGSSLPLPPGLSRVAAWMNEP
jgi:pimeloyl-ACP methyl ester carboxylesterase